MTDLMDDVVFEGAAMKAEQALKDFMDLAIRQERRFKWTETRTMLNTIRLLEECSHD